MKKFIEWTGTLVGKLVLLFLSLILIGILIYIGYYAYLDTHAEGAKEYLIEKYDMEKFDYVCTSYVEYIYSDLTDCDSNWFKECTQDPTLAYKYVFTNKNKNKITVVETKEGNYTDDFENVNT